MNLPYTQVASELVDIVAPDLAVILDWNEDAALCGVIRLHRWMLRRCPEGELPSEHDLVDGPAAALLVARTAGWMGDPEPFAKACETVRPAILERTETGIRIKGLDRYDPVVESAKARSEHASHAAKVRWEKLKQSSHDAPAVPEHAPGTAQDMPEDAKTQKKTQRKKVNPPPPTPSLEPVAEPAVVEEGVQDFLGFWRKTAGAGHVSLSVPPGLAALLESKREEFGEDYFAVMSAAVESFHEDDEIKCHTLDVFVHPEVLGRRLAEAKRKVAKGRPKAGVRL